MNNQTFKPGDLVWRYEYGSWWQAKVVLVEGKYAFVVETSDYKASRVPFRKLRHR